MPRLSVWMIRAAMLHLAAGFTLGGLLLFNKGIPLSPDLWRLLPAHLEFLLIGWTTQLALGVAHWILPRHKFGPKRGDERPAWAAFALINAGVACVVSSQWLGPPGWWALAGRAIELIAIGLFAASLWPRVKPAGV